MKSAGKARSNGLYRHIRTSKEIIRNLLNDYYNAKAETTCWFLLLLFFTPLLIGMRSLCIINWE